MLFSSYRVYLDKPCHEVYVRNNKREQSLGENSLQDFSRQSERRRSSFSRNTEFSSLTHVGGRVAKLDKLWKTKKERIVAQ
ncbi:hypothetical protein KM043_004466 [Ampulex compressa]|nr:hypothetical protein KM043_004466 [Ampulex compressa]